MNIITLKLDLWDYKQVENTCRLAAEKLGIPREQLENDLLNLTLQLEQYRDHLQDKPRTNRSDKKVLLNQSTITQCLEFLKQPGLITRINILIGRAGITGEETNRILLFVIASSYKMHATLHGLIQGSSGSGKTRLLRVISELMPPEDIKRYTRVTDNSFYNQDEYFLSINCYALKTWMG